MRTELVDKQAVAATFKVTVPSDVVDEAFDRVLTRLAREVRVPGFRPGKAPRGVLARRIGAETLSSEVRESLVDEHYPKAVRELELMPVHAHFHGDAPVEGEDFTFEVHADLYPEFELPDVAAIEIETRVPELDEDQVEQTVARLRDEHATLVPVDRPIAEGDVVFVETLGEGGGSTMPIDLTRSEPRLVEQLLGRAIGDEVTLDLGPDPVTGEGEADADGTESDAAESEAQDGARRTLTVRLGDVKAKELPEPDDAFAVSLGFETWEQALAEIRAGLTASLEREAERAQREELIDRLVAATQVELPAYLVNRRKSGLLQDLAEDLHRQQGMTLDAYVDTLEQRGTRAEFEGELQQAAERGVKRDLVLEALLEQRGTTVSDDEFDAALRQMAARRRLDVARFRSEMGETWLENYRFLLARDRAVREVVAEKTGRARREDPEADAEAAAAAAETAAHTEPEGRALDD